LFSYLEMMKPDLKRNFKATKTPLLKKTLRHKQDPMFYLKQVWLSEGMTKEL